jgi:hypothetical protein
VSETLIFSFGHLMFGLDGGGFTVSSSYLRKMVETKNSKYNIPWKLQVLEVPKLIEATVIFVCIW